MDPNIELLLELIPVPGESTKESEISAKIRAVLSDMGVPDDCMCNDDAYKQSEYGGNTGNLVVRLDGHGKGERRMLSTHMDTVPGCIGSRPAVRDGRIVNEAEDRALGGDARAGCACLLAAARAIMERKGDHPPWTFVFFVQEELGLVGSRGMDPKNLGTPVPAMCFNFDGGEANELANAVIGTERLNINITGVAAHASRPHLGISAAVILAEALAELQRDGWNCRIDRPEGQGSANLGILRGGKGSNVVMPELYALAEARSFDREFRSRIVEAWKDAIQRSVERNNERGTDAGGSASVEFSPGPVYDPYRLPEETPVVRAAVAAMAQCGLKPWLFDHVGGLDCNNIVAKGIPAVGLGMGDREAHSVKEWVDLEQFTKACELAVALALGSE